MAAVPANRSRYYDALISNLDREVQPELTSDRARFLYAAARRMLARLAVANEHTPALAENLAAAHPSYVPPSSAPPPGAISAAPRAADVRAEGEILDGIESAVQLRLGTQAAASGTAAAATPISAAALHAYLEKKLDSAVKVESFRILAGGRSKQTIMLDIIDAEGRHIERVIRRDLVVGITGATVLDEYQVLAAMAERGYPVPRPLLLETDTTQLGSAFMLMEKVPGALAGDVFDAPPSAAAVLDSARILGQLHAIPAGEIAPTMRAGLRAALDAKQLHAQVLELQRTWQANARAPSATMDAVFAWLLEHSTSVTPLVSVVHADYSYHNLLYVGESLSAVMDWELVHIGHPAEDLGYIRSAALQRVRWPDFLAAYQAGGGMEIPHHDIVFFTLLGKLRLLSMLFFARQYFESGATQDLQLADVSLYHLPRLIHQCSVEIRAVLD